MRYAQRGGYTPAEQQRRERLRMEAAGRFACGDEISEIARELRVTEGSVRRWQRAWREGGTEALRSKGPVSRERLSPQQWARLELELRKGPLAHGFELQMLGASVIWSERAMLSLAKTPPENVLDKLESASEVLGVAAELRASVAVGDRTPRA